MCPSRPCNFCDDVIAEDADVSLGAPCVEPIDLMGDEPTFSQTQAGGFRQRRDGLAYRLCYARPWIEPRKRMEPNSTNLT